MSDEKYVIVTAISSHRMRYCIPVSELKKLNEEVEATDLELLEWARDCVTCEQVKEFSQEWIGEQILDSVLQDEDTMLQTFDTDNEYLSSWDKEQKLRYVKEWRDPIPS